MWYTTYNKELLAICDAVVNWHHYPHSDRTSSVHMDHASSRHILTQPWLTAPHIEYLATFHNYTYHNQYIAGMKNLVGDALMRRPEFSRERCQVPQCRLTLLVVQDLTEWFWGVTAKMKDDSWRKDIVQILVSKESQEHQPKASALATVRKAWACCHRVSLDDGLLHLDHQKQDPEKHKVEPHQLYIPTPLRNTIFRAGHDAAVGGHIGAPETTLLLAGMWKGVQD